MKLFDKLKGLLKPKEKPAEYIYLIADKYSYADIERLPKNHICLKDHTAWLHIYNYVDAESSALIKAKKGDEKFFSFHDNHYVMDTVSKTIYLFSFKGLITTDIEFISYVKEVKRTDPYPIIEKE